MLPGAMSTRTTGSETPLLESNNREVTRAAILFVAMSLIYQEQYGHTLASPLRGSKGCTFSEIWGCGNQSLCAQHI